jgi:hypothetical protein
MYIDIMLPRKKADQQLHMAQNIKAQLDQRGTASLKIATGNEEYAVCPHFYSTFTVSTLPRKVLKGSETS